MKSTALVCAISRRQSPPTQHEPAYVERAGAHRQLRENRQAIRDYTKALDLDPKANLYQDRASAESELKEFQAAILDYTKSIARGCEETLCGAYEYRADVYLRLHDCPLASSDLGHAIRNYLAGTIFGFNIDQFRRIYPEYDDIADDVLCEKLRVLFNPQMSYADYSKQFLIDAKEFDVTVLPELFLKGVMPTPMWETSLAQVENMTVCLLDFRSGRYTHSRCATEHAFASVRR